MKVSKGRLAAAGSPTRNKRPLIPCSAHARTESAGDTLRGSPAPPFDAIESKLHVPTLRTGTVSRAALVNRLRITTEPTLLLTAPAGYGKTTLLSQWAARDSRPFAWVSVDERDNDPVVLLRHVALALQHI